MLKYVSVINLNFFEEMISISVRYPIRVILLCVALGVVFSCLKQRFLMSAGLILILLVFLVIGTFTNLLTFFLKDIPIMLQYVAVIIYTILFCIVYDYESSLE